MTIEQFLRHTTMLFATAGITSARLDAQVLLGRALRQNKVWLLAHRTDEISADVLPVLQQQTRRRASRQPLAYILGWREFYGRRFSVNPSVLIPRPETEQIIETLKTLPLPGNAAVLDVGTGSGAIAITAALELPQLRVQACDISLQALELAKQNAIRLDVPEGDIHFFASDLLAQAHGRYDVIVANLPYVARNWQRSPETAFEPELALFADEEGLALIKKLIAQTPKHLNKKGFLLLEADPRQHETIKKIAHKHDFAFVRADDFILCFSH